MIDFSDLKLIKKKSDDTRNYSFVGIQKNQSSGEYEFWLPHGFDDFPEGDYDSTMNFFFSMYKTFRRFESLRLKDEDNYIEKKTTAKDQTVLDGGLRLTLDDGDGIVLYSKIRMIEDVLEGYNELVIFSLEKKLGNNENINFDKVGSYLDKAVYLDDNSFFINEMDLPRLTIQTNSTDIVEMYSFIYTEIMYQLNEDSPAKALTLANLFREKYLTKEHSIFSRTTFKETIKIMKDALESIDNSTFYKDHDYWKIYECIENFLYGSLDTSKSDNGRFWGIDNFCFVWEDMCHAYCLSTFDEGVIFADTNLEIEGVRWGRYFDKSCEKHYLCDAVLKDRFVVSLSGNEKLRKKIRPDLVRIKQIPSPLCMRIKNPRTSSNPKPYGLFATFTIDVNPNYPNKESANKALEFHRKKLNRLNGVRQSKSQSKPYTYHNVKTTEKEFISLLEDCSLDEGLKVSNSIVKMLDFKYHSTADFNRGVLSYKLKLDIVKQLTYELCVKGLFEEVEHEFVVPYYREGKSIGDYLDLVDDKLLPENIKIFRTNFFEMQKAYLSL